MFCNQGIETLENQNNLMIMLQLYYLRIAKEGGETRSQLNDSVLSAAELIILSINASNSMGFLIGMKVQRIKMAR